MVQKVNCVRHLNTFGERPLMRKSLIFCSLLLVLAGCQTGNLRTSSTTLDNASFMGLWEVYNHCQSSNDLDSMRGDVKQLTLAAQTPVRDNPTLQSLIKPIKRWVSEPPTRLAVDLKAMAVACTLYTGQAALNIGRDDVATEMFSSVVLRTPQPEFAYYVQQAKIGLSQVGTSTELVRASTPKVIPVSAPR